MSDKPGTFYVEPQTPGHDGPVTSEEYPSGLIGPAQVIEGTFVQHPLEPSRSEGEPKK